MPYTIPKNWGTTGIAYWSSKVNPGVTSWKDFFAQAGTTYKGKALIVDHQISSFGSAAVAMGYSLNTIDPTEMAAVEKMLIGAQAEPFRHLSRRPAAPARKGHVALDRMDRRRRAGRARQSRRRQVRRRQRRWRTLDRQLHDRGRCTASAMPPMRSSTG